MKSGMGSHESARMKNDEWLTPPEIVASLGRFDLDPCSPGDRRPWDTAEFHYSKKEDGLLAPWFGRVWLNPPYGKHTAAWLERLAEHGDGIALIFARTETAMFFNSVWPKASAIFFLKGRLSFFSVSGTKATMNAGAPSCLVAYGRQNAIALKNCGLAGKFIELVISQGGSAQFCTGEGSL